MKVSIIIPVHNVEQYIERCLSSVCAQTYHDIECILIDDCSTDGSICIAKDFINKYKGNIHFVLLYNNYSVGPAESRNNGLKVATGDYVYYLDSDDAITPCCLELLITLANKYPDAEFVQGNMVQGVAGLRESSFISAVPEYCNEKSELEKLVLIKTVVLVCSRMIKRQFLIDNSLFFKKGILHEDVYWIYFLSKKVNAAAFTNEGTYLYYDNEGSISRAPSMSVLLKRYSSLKQIAKVIVDDMKSQSGGYSRSQLQYLFCVLAAFLKILPRISSIHCWVNYWRLVWITYFQLRPCFLWRNVLLFVFMMPPFCFLSAQKFGLWRIQHYLLREF